MCVFSTAIIAPNQLQGVSENVPYETRVSYFLMHWAIFSLFDQFLAKCHPSLNMQLECPNRLQDLVIGV